MGTPFVKNANTKPHWHSPSPLPRVEFLGICLSCLFFIHLQSWALVLFAVYSMFQPVFFSLTTSWKSFQGNTYAVHLESLPSSFLLWVLPFVRAELYFITWIVYHLPLAELLQAMLGWICPYVPAFCVTGEQCLRVLWNYPPKRLFPFLPIGCAQTYFSISSWALHVISL